MYTVKNCIDVKVKSKKLHVKVNCSKVEVKIRAAKHLRGEEGGRGRAAGTAQCLEGN